ncbi:Photosystem I assembly protein Ycf3 [compost metagenome]
MNKQKIFSIAIVLLAIFLIGRKIFSAPENGLIKKVNSFYYAGNYQQAKKELENHLKENPNSLKGWNYLGLVNLDLNDTLGAEKAYGNALKLDKNSEGATIGLGVVERMKGNYSKAKAYYESALKLNPKSADAYASMLVLEIKNRNYASAVALGEKAKGLGFIDKTPGILGNLVVAYHFNKQIKERDQGLAELEKMNYKDIEYTKMLINGSVDFNDVF